MKKLLSLTLAAIFAVSALVSCAPAKTAADAASASSYADRAWLEKRIGDVPDGVSVGTAGTLGIDMSAFEDDGYVIRTEDGETVVCGKTAVGLDLAVRKYAKAYEAGQDVPDTVYHEGYRIEKLTIAGRDIADYTITYEGGCEPNNAGEGQVGRLRDNAYAAAREMQILVEKACGVHLDIVPADAKVSPAIRIGYYTAGDLGENGFTYEVKGGDLLINGVGDANGCDNAVCYLLENECGWEGLLDGDSYLNEADHIDLAEGLSVSVDPMFDFFNPYNRNKFDSFRNDRIYGRYAGIINRANHGQTNRNWGKLGTASSYQLCYSDETNQMAILEDVGVYLEEHEAAGNPVEYVDLAMGDNRNFCKCKDCMKVIKEENLSDVGPIIRFVNRVANEYAADYPDVKFLMFAYLDTIKAPVTAPADNVWITYCTDHACVTHSLAGGECDESIFAPGEIYIWFNNNEHAKNIAAWGKLTPNMYLWSYGIDTSGHQLTQIRNFYKDYMFIKECGFKGLLFENEYCGLGEGRIRLQAISILQYHPDYTEDEYNEALHRLYEREFGDGADEIIAYSLNYWDRAQRAAGCISGFNWEFLLMPGSNDYETFHEDEEKALALLEKAIYLADSAAQEKACERFSCDLIYKICYYNYFRAYDRGDSTELARLDALYATFLGRMAANGLGKGYKGLFGSAGKLMVEWQPTLEGEAWVNWKKWRAELSDEGVEHKPDLTVEPATEPVTEPVTEPITEPITEPVTEPEEPSDPRAAAYEKAVAKIKASPIDFDSAILTEDIVTAIANETFTEPKNIIFMIGDGMGFNAINAGEAANKSALLDGQLAMRYFPVRGESMTYSASANITDSGAGGTALASGYKTTNLVVGKSWDLSSDLKSNLERAAEKGMSTGVVTTDLITGATPSDFTVHVDNRALPEDIAAQQIARVADGTVDLLFGGGSQYYGAASNKSALDAAVSGGLTYGKSWNEVKDASLPVIGLFSADMPDTASASMPSLALQVDWALEKLSQDEDGFFLMVEGSQIDYAGHNNLLSMQTREVYSFDKAVAVAMRFAALNPDTVVIVTADHETGGVRTPYGVGPDTYKQTTYAYDDHTGVTVPCFALGYGTEVLARINENVDIGRFTASLLGDDTLPDATRTADLFTDTPDYASVNSAGIVSATEPAVTVTLNAKGKKFCIPADTLTTEGPIRAVQVKVKNGSEHYADTPMLTFEAGSTSLTVRSSIYYLDPGEERVLTYFVPSDLWGKQSTLTGMYFKISGQGVYRDDVTLTFSDFTAVIRPLDENVAAKSGS